MSPFPKKDKQNYKQKNKLGKVFAGTPVKLKEMQNKEYRNQKEKSSKWK